MYQSRFHLFKFPPPIFFFRLLFHNKLLPLCFFTARETTCTNPCWFFFFCFLLFLGTSVKFFFKLNSRGLQESSKCIIFPHVCMQRHVIVNARQHAYIYLYTHTCTNYRQNPQDLLYCIVSNASGTRWSAWKWEIGREGDKKEDKV